METAESRSEETFKITDLITYEYDSEDVRRPTGINIFQLCKALLDGHAEKLSEKVLLHDGPVHLFDVCLQHDVWCIACEMASRGVEGCELQMQHLDPFEEFHSSSDEPCRCMGWNECEYCCWGFPLHQGTWMPDFDVGIWGACEAAEEAVGRTWVRKCLRMASSGEKLPFAVSDGAMARLLDIAILTGNQKAATELAAKCKVLPLRRWRSVDFISYGQICLQDVLVAALSAGVSLWNLWAAPAPAPEPSTLLWGGRRRILQHFTRTSIPFREAVFLLSNSACADLMPQSPQQRQQPWKPADGNNLAPYFFDKGQIDLEKIRLGIKAGLELKCITGSVRPATATPHQGVCEAHREQLCQDCPDFDCTLLDLCILTGQIQAARCVASQLQQESYLGERMVYFPYENIYLVRGDSGLFRVDVEYDCDSDDAVFITVASPSSCLLAAGAAAKAALRASFKHHARVIYQTNRDASAKKNMKNVPPSVVKEILVFSTEAPAWVDQLNLWEGVDGWCDSASIPSTQFLDSADTGAGATMVPSEESDQQPGTMETQDTSTIDQKSTDELLMALQASRDEVPALNIDGVCIFRLTRRAKCTEVNEVLLDPTGPLASLHKRVLDAGCQVNPEGNPVKALFVPCTEQQLVELQNLAAHGYELCKDQHVLALQDDGPVIDRALRSCISKKDRPRLQKLCPRVIPGDSADSHQAAQSSTDVAPDADNDEDDSNEPMLMLECGFRTDSSLAYPSYSNQV